MASEGLSGQAFCRVCKKPCGSCGCRLGGCFTEAWWAEQYVAEGAPSADAAPPLAVAMHPREP